MDTYILLRFRVQCESYGMSEFVFAIKCKSVQYFGLTSITLLPSQREQWQHALASDYVRYRWRNANKRVCVEQMPAKSLEIGLGCGPNGTHGVENVATERVLARAHLIRSNAPKYIYIYIGMYIRMACNWALSFPHRKNTSSV